jgi:SAM-dependent methyltransferase
MIGKVVALETLSPGAVVLDLACGTGITTIWLAESRPDIEIIALDISAEMIVQAKAAIEARHLQNVRLVMSSAFELTPGALQHIKPSYRFLMLHMRDQDYEIHPKGSFLFACCSRAILIPTKDLISLLFNTIRLQERQVTQSHNS